MYTYEELKEFVDHCHRCPLCQTRNHSVMGKGNRDPFPEEQEACIPYLKYETALLHPKIIVCLGLTAVYHPSAVLRDATKLPQIQEDFRKIRELLDQFSCNSEVK